MKQVAVLLLLFSLLSCNIVVAQQAVGDSIPGFRSASAERALEEKFLSVPDPKLAEEHLRILTSAPHIAGSPEDRKTAEYVAQKFREAGLETRIDEYRVWLNYPGEVLVETTSPAGLHMRGPNREHVDADPFQDDPRVVMPYNGGSPSGEVEAEVVYANYGRPEDYKKLEQLGVDVRGKIVIVRYGQNFRGVKSFVAQEKGAAGVILYSDPQDDGYYKGDMYPRGPYRPDTGVQRGSVQFMFEYPGDPTTPGIASTPSLPDSKRIDPSKATSLPRIPTTPLSYADATPILSALGGPETPRDWQGALPFTYHVGPGPVKVHIKLVQNWQWVTIWNVVGTIRGTEHPEEWVVAGNHRDAWVYGAVDPNSGTTAMLEAVHGLGELLKTGWRPKRTIVFGSWDAEEHGLVGSTEFAEQYTPQLEKAVAYFNIDAGVGGPNFGAAGVPSLKTFLREVTRAVSSPKGGTVYDAWKLSPGRGTHPGADGSGEPQVDDLGSGSDYTPFFQHLGVPATDIGSGGSYGVYHSVFDNFAWFKKFADPSFVYEQQMARVFGLQVLRMAQCDMLPYDYETYGSEIRRYIENAKKRADETQLKPKPDFAPALAAADRLIAAGNAMASYEASSKADTAKLNATLIRTERALLTGGLPRRPWFKHAIYAPGEYTGYTAVVIPGVNEAIGRGDAELTGEQLKSLTRALEKAAATLESTAGQ